MRYWGDIELSDEDELGERCEVPDLCPSKTNPSQTLEPVFEDRSSWLAGRRASILLFGHRRIDSIRANFSAPCSVVTMLLLQHDME